MQRIIVLALALALALPLAVLGAYATPAGAATDRLPDLAMARLTQIQIQNTNGHRLLRFTTTIVNVGAGKFELRGSRPNRGIPTMRVTQRIFDSAGDFRNRPTTAQMYFAGDGHNHWHTKNLARYTLTPLNNNGVRVRRGAKQGFCFRDNHRFGSTQAAYYTSCGHDSRALKQRMGISRGWGDTYWWKTAGQYINVTGLPKGRYRLRVTADAANWFAETKNNNNSTWADIRIRGANVSVIKYGPAAQPI